MVVKSLYDDHFHPTEKLVKRRIKEMKTTNSVLMFNEQITAAAMFEHLVLSPSSRTQFQVLSVGLFFISTSLITLSLVTRLRLYTIC